MLVDRNCASVAAMSDGHVAAMGGRPSKSTRWNVGQRKGRAIDCGPAQRVCTKQVLFGAEIEGFLAVRLDTLSRVWLVTASAFGTGESNGCLLYTSDAADE